jgi:hypothetical protein
MGRSKRQVGQFNPLPLRRARLLKGWNLRKLAKVIEKSEATCSLVLAGKVCNPATVAAIADALGVDLAEVWPEQPGPGNGGGPGGQSEIRNPKSAIPAPRHLRVLAGEPGKVQGRRHVA